MTQEQKDLLLKDLCARLPYRVKVRYSSYNGFINCTLHSINSVYNDVNLWSKNACFSSISISKIKPYLFPLSSMTEEQQLFYSTDLNYMPYYQRVDWFNEHHLDYRGLISMGLALDATGLNIY